MGAKGAKRKTVVRGRGVRAGLTRMERKAKVAGLIAKRRDARFLKDGSVRESIIQADIMRWLKSTGLMFWRSNSGSLFLRGRHINLGPLGCADISIVVPPSGRFVGMEVKSAKGRIRKDQVTYAAGLTAQGGAYFIVRSVQDAKDAIAQLLGEAAWKSQFGPRVDY